MDVTNLVAIDMHTHAERSERISADPMWLEMQEASERYFKRDEHQLSISQIAAYYRETPIEGSADWAMYRSISNRSKTILPATGR